MIKIGLKNIPALTFAGLRYSLAFGCLLTLLLLSPGRRAELRRMTPRQWRLLIALGLIYYAVVQGAQFLGLAYLPAATVSLTLNFTSVAVALMGLAWLNERPGRLGWLGMAISALGALVFFYPVRLEGRQALGLAISVVGMLANAVSSVLGRRINAGENLSPLLVTTVSMGVGGPALLLAGLLAQPTPTLDARGWALVAWLALVNTAVAFTLWNTALRSLTAMESSLINGTMLIQITLLAWAFLGEALTPLKVTGMLLVAIGVAVVQLTRP